MKFQQPLYGFQESMPRKRTRRGIHFISSLGSYLSDESNALIKCMGCSSQKGCSPWTNGKGSVSIFYFKTHAHGFINISKKLTCSSTFASCIARKVAGNAWTKRMAIECPWDGECIKRIKRHPFLVHFRALGLGKVNQGVNKKNIKKEKKG